MRLQPAVLTILLHGPGMAAVDGKLYVTGGGNKASTENTTCGEVLDLKTMQWEALPPMRTARKRHGGWLIWGCV